MSLGQYVAARVRRPTARVYVNGFNISIPDESGAISLGWAVGQPVAGGSIRLHRPWFEPEIKMPVTVTWGYNDFEVYAFTGFVIDPGRQAYPWGRAITVRDILWLADFPVRKEGINLGNNMTATEALTILLRDYSGIPAERIQIPEFEQSPGEPWLLGTLTPVAFGKVSPLQACIQICDPLGYQLYADEGGYVRARQITGAPSVGPVAYYREGRDFLVDGAPTVTSNGDQIITKVLVTGALTNLITGPSGEMEAVAVRDSWQQDNHPYLPHGQHREMDYSNDLIEFVNEEQAGDASCTGVAKRLLLEHSRTPFTVNVPKMKADPRLGIGMTVALREPRIGINSYRKFFVMSINRTFGGGVFEESKVLDGGIGETGYSTIPPPTAVFIVRRMREWLDGVENIELFLDGGASRGYGTPEVLDEEGNPVEPPEDTLSTIQSYAWTDNSTPPKTAEGKTATFIYAVGSPDPEICLTVTDVTAKIDTECQTIVLEGDLASQPIRRELSFAAGDTWYVTQTGGQVWRHESGSNKAYAVPPISGLGSEAAPRDAAAAIGLLAGAGTTGGGLRSTLDYLRTGSTLVNAGGGSPIQFLWQHEKNPARVWAAIGEQAYLSVNGGVLFTPVSHPNPGFPVLWVVNSVDDENVVDFLAGSNMYTSWDAGTHVTATLEGPAGSTARCYVSGFERHWVGFSGVPEGSSPLRSVEGGTAAFPIDITPAVTEIRALTMLVDRPILIAIDQVGRIWHLDVETGGNAEHTATMPDAPEAP